MSESPDTEYTPTTDDIIRAYSLPLTSTNPRLPNESFAEWLGRGSIETHSHQMASERAARRWLAAHDREVAAKALEDAAAVLDQPYTLWWEATVGVKVREHGYDDISRGVELIEWFRARAACIREGNTE